MILAPTKQCLVIEDNPVDQIRVRQILDELGYKDITVVDTLSAASEFLSISKPSLIIVDFFLSDGQSGVGLLSISDVSTIVTIFVSDSPNMKVYQSVKAAGKVGFLTKPLELFALQNTIDLLDLHNEKVTLPVVNKHFFIRDQGKSVKVAFDDILWLSADGNYTFVHTRVRKYIIKKSLQRMAEQLDERFIQTHRKYVVNVEYIKELKTGGIMLDNELIPLSYTYRKNVMSRLQWLVGRTYIQSDKGLTS